MKYPGTGLSRAVSIEASESSDLIVDAEELLTGEGGLLGVSGIFVGSDSGNVLFSDSRSFLLSEIGVLGGSSGFLGVLVWIGWLLSLAMKSAAGCFSGERFLSVGTACLVISGWRGSLFFLLPFLGMCSLSRKVLESGLLPLELLSSLVDPSRFFFEPLGGFPAKGEPGWAPRAGQSPPSAPRPPLDMTAYISSGLRVRRCFPAAGGPPLPPPPNSWLRKDPHSTHLCNRHPRGCSGHHLEYLIAKALANTLG